MNLTHIQNRMVIHYKSSDWAVEHLEWHFDQGFCNVHQIPFDSKTQKYKANIDYYAMTIAHIMSYFDEIWTMLTYMKLYDQNNEYRDRLLNVVHKCISEFRLFRTRKNVDRIKHIKYWLEYDELMNNVELIVEKLYFPAYISRDKANELAKIYQSQLDELIKFIADDDASTENFINKLFK